MLNKPLKKLKDSAQLRKKPVIYKTLQRVRPPVEIDEPKQLPAVHLERAAELIRPLRQEPTKKSGLMGSLKTVVQRVSLVKQDRPEHEEVLEKMEHIFVELHNDFDQRETMLDQKLQRIEAMQVRETRMLKWFSIPLTIVAMVGLSFLFYIAYSMQHSVADMSQNMTAMSGDISSMTANTQAMSTNMSNITGSIQNMNSNMAYMTRDVGTMNRNMGSISHSMAPMGQAAQTASPMLGMMRKFMPF